jgi:hypothetical protein
MRRATTLAVALALVVAACGGSTADEEDSGGLATLTDDTSAQTEVTTATEPEETVEEQVLAFADCMRDNGVPDFQDPIVNADGSVEFVGVGPGAGDDGEPDQALFDAFEVCSEFIEGIAFGAGGSEFDINELQDSLIAFAACLRENGLDVDDPDLSGLFGGNRDDGDDSPAIPTGPEALFGDRVDFEDPENEVIFEKCAERVNLTAPGT